MHNHLLFLHFIVARQIGGGYKTLLLELFTMCPLSLRHRSFNIKLSRMRKR